MYLHIVIKFMPFFGNRMLAQRHVMSAGSGTCKETIKWKNLTSKFINATMRRLTNPYD